MISIILMSMVVVSSYVSAAPLSTICQIPDDLHDHYQTLSRTMKGLAYLKVNTGPTPSLNPDENSTIVACPSKLRTEGKINDRSTCPWKDEIHENPDLYPSNWITAKCLCDKCIGFNGEYSCESVYSRTLFLKRTKCEKGTYIYEILIESIRTGCVCALKPNAIQSVSN